WKEMLGYTDDEIDGTVDAWESRLHPDDRERVHQELNRHFKHPNSTYVSEHRLRCKDGSYKWVLDRGKVMLREIDGTPLRMLGTHTDITETKAAEQQLKESEEAFRTIFAASPLGVSLIDAQEQYVDVNDAFLEMHGVDRDKVIGKGVFEAGLLEEGSERGDLILSVQRAGGVLSSDVRFIRRDGERHEGLMIVKIITLHGRMYALGFLLDVSGQKRAEREKLEMERCVLHAQKLESLGVLAGGVAHDFNNLLMAMLGNLNIAMQKLPASNPVYMNITRAEQAVHRASELTRQMLAYSGKGKFIIKQISLTELVQECSALLRMSVAHTISFEQHLADNLPFIKADPGQVEQVVMNLITNASEAIGTSPGVITLTTGVKEYTAEQLSQSRLDVKASPGVYVWLETTDTGCGMGEETQKRLFEPFFPTKFTGRGLGMSAVLGILRGHQGAIFVESRLQQGTRIRVLFPAVAAGDNLGRETEVPKTSLAPEIPRPILSILVVDDEEMIREVAHDLLHELEYPVLLAVDGEDALRVFSQHRETIGCIILDLSMPRMDGLSAVKELKKIDPDVRIILSSGYNEQAALQRYSNIGLAGFLQKPYTMEGLRTILAMTLAGNGSGAHRST
ncbi:MAG: PAS domain S-box protein, partial [Ignavibacteriales bacterium]|nr:PAS domain S-box protein [Ignavibacteriales bacterium]